MKTEIMKRKMYSLASRLIPSLPFGLAAVVFRQPAMSRREDRRCFGAIIKARWVYFKAPRKRIPTTYPARSCAKEL